jgi:hypothetical protein
LLMECMPCLRTWCLVRIMKLWCILLREMPRKLSWLFA